MTRRGRIVFPGVVRDCAIPDLSRAGARIRLPGAEEVPLPVQVPPA